MSQDKERGILSQRDIDFLEGNMDISSAPKKSNIKQIIRERVQEALRDFEILCNHWDSDQIKKALDEMDNSQRTDSKEAATHVVEFLYLALNTQARPPESLFDPSSDPIEEFLKFETSVCEGIKNGKAHFGQKPNSVSIDSTVSLQEPPKNETIIENVDPDRLLEVWKQVNEKYQEASVASEEGTKKIGEDEVFIDRSDIESVIDDIKLEWGGDIAKELDKQYQKSGDFRRGEVVFSYDIFK